ncbi:MAG: hypothetical protein JNN06_11995 [Gemmobacter sp.]|uniref:hypothetical protein n=1 Tax=Gemmobacter sp. TaxID=1898957 RepID=UPI001A5C26D5|nr:hypothetical protein [Gemmobacter sp.]MBL8562991.1 hypothetical protein [Gemmobacter sp.]
MGSIMFSAYFTFRPERLRFMERVQAELAQDVRLILFNLAETLTCDLDVVNAIGGLQPALPDPVGALEEFLRAEMPELAAQLMTHMRGEFEEGEHDLRAPVTMLLQRLRNFRDAIETRKPDFVFLWNQFNVLHRIAAEMLRRRNIRFGFFHDGLLPGSIAFDFDGEMGNSWISRDPERFCQVEVSQEDCARARAFIDGLSGAEVNQRHVQRDDVILAEVLRLRRLDRRPVLFLAGQNDWHAGILPKAPQTGIVSPIFDSSSDALSKLDAIAGETGFTVVYKPHPLCRDRHLFLNSDAFPNSLILKSTSLQGCMQASALVSTIASQTCYPALLAGHPMMMFGRNQITGKGLTYDVTRLEDIPGQIERALADPLAEGRRESLARHIAQLERSYLLDYGTLAGGFYRRGAGAVARILRACIAHSGDEMIEMQARGALL